MGSLGASLLADRLSSFFLSGIGIRIGIVDVLRGAGTDHYGFMVLSSS